MGTNQYGSYDAEFLLSSDFDGQQSSINYDASTGDKGVFSPKVPVLIMGFGCQVTTAYTAPTTAQVVALDHRPTYGSDTGRTELATITMSAARPAGRVVHKRINPVKVLPGQQVIIKQKTAGAGGAGAATWYFLYALCPESSANCTNLELLT